MGHGVTEGSGPGPLERLSTTPLGLSEEEAARRLQIHGPNRIERLRRRPLGLRFLAQFTSLFALLLWVAGVFALLAGMEELGWAVFAVIVVNGAFSFLQEYRAERALEALRKLLPHEVAVRRGGAASRRPVESLVPGDVVVLSEGDQVPADAEVLEAAGLRVDQSSLTGESHAVFKVPSPGSDAKVPKLERGHLLFAGTSVVAGSAAAVVTATGMTTEIGTLARLTQTVREEESPLQREMSRVTRIVTVLAISFGVVFFVLGVATQILPPREGFLFALGIIVANVPEGLMPTMTLALAIGVQRLARRRSVVKRLSAVEALGGTTVICSDKTGTLTENRMELRAVSVAGSTIEPLDAAAPRAETRDILRVAVLGSLAGANEGDPTESALVRAALAAGIDVDEIRRLEPIVAPHPFDSFRKRMTLVRRGPGGPVAYVKGAASGLLPLCDVEGDGVGTTPLTAEHRARLIEDHQRLAEGGLRVLLVASRPLDPGDAGTDTERVESGLRLHGLVALWDPPRPEVAAAVTACEQAGIRVVMITGDDGRTARAVADRIGLPVSRVIEGEEWASLDPTGRGAAIREPGALFARTSPTHKLEIVRALEARGETVAVTGDGVNDAPALRAATIGVAMGGRGTEVAKEAAVVVVTDDNFASIVEAIRQGRAIVANMGKFVTYIFASNVPEMVPFLAAVLFGIPLPLTVMQILAIDLGTDLLPALALGAEPPEPDVMRRRPRRSGSHLLHPQRLLHAYGFLGVIEAMLAMTAFFWTYWVSGWRPGIPMEASGELYMRATTMTLAGIVAAQVGNVFACRSERESVFAIGLLRNPVVFLAIAAELTLLALLIFTPPLARVFGVLPLRPQEWMILPLFPLILLAAEEARKAIMSRRFMTAS